jgi:Region found in RelA / SpoT proteins
LNPPVTPWKPGERFPWSKSQVNGAGDRLRRAAREREPISDRDREILSDYRAWHYPALRHGQDRLKRLFHKRIGLEPAIVDVGARPLKTEAAIVAKLVREQTRLSRMQDIAGSRLTVPSLDLQDAAMGFVMQHFAKCDPRVVRDTREEADRYGYRAAHLVVTLEGRFVEIQIRTAAQNAWAQIVESLDEVLGSDLKHGRGPADWLEWLHELSDELRKRDLGQPFQVPPSPFDREQNQ